MLPTLPEVALRVREVVDDEDANLGDIVGVISTDAALSARLVQVANSPLMRGSRAVESVDMAVSRLGMKMVRDMVVSMAMQQMFQATADITDRKLRAVWEHSVQVAAISHALASGFTRLAPEQAMLAGLVHDIGVLPVLVRAEDTPELLEDEALLNDLIRAAHGPLGNAILEAWNFPPDLVAVAEGHEDLERVSGRADYVDVVTVANLQSYLGTNHPTTDLDWRKIPAFRQLGLSPEVNVVELAETAENIREVHSILTS
jgi:HD-like signal output (HDOD) protein